MLKFTLCGVNINDSIMLESMCFWVTIFLYYVIPFPQTTNLQQMTFKISSQTKIWKIPINENSLLKAVGEKNVEIAYLFEKISFI